MDIQNLIPQDRETLIINYLHGNLSKQESIQFKQALKVDPDLRNQTERLRNLIFVLEQPELVKLEGELLEMRATNIASMEGEVSFLKKQWKRLNSFGKVAATFITTLLLLILVLVVGTITLGTDSSHLFWKYCQPAPLNLIQINPDEQILWEGSKSYKAGDWESAAFQFDLVSERDISYQFYAVISHLMKTPNNESEHLERLQQLEASLDLENPFHHHFRDWIDFYRSLIYFKLEDHETGSAIITDLYERDDITGMLKGYIDELFNKIEDTRFFF